jgi:hypothetical protein
MTSAGFNPATPPTKRPQTYALYRAATGIGCMKVFDKVNRNIVVALCVKIKCSKDRQLYFY